MNFNFSDDQILFRHEVREVVETDLRPLVDVELCEDSFPWKMWEKVADLGYFGLRYPKRYGGQDADATISTILYEELGKLSTGFALTVVMQSVMGTWFLANCGTEELKLRLLAPALKGNKIGTICLTEEGAGSDPLNIRTTAKRDQNGWRINGNKLWVSNGQVCDFFIVAANTDFSRGIDGIAFFVVERNMPGVIDGQIINKIGTYGCMANELQFKEVIVPFDHFLGDESHGGLAQAERFLCEARVASAIVACALSSRLIDLVTCRTIADSCSACGSIELSSSGLLYSARASVEAARLLAYRSAWAMEHGRDCLSQSTLAKVFASEVCQAVAHQIQSLPNLAQSPRSNWTEQALADARFFLFGSGCNEPQRDYLGSVFLERLP